MGARETELLLVKRQGCEFTLRSATQRLGRAEASLRGIFRKHNFIQFIDLSCRGCECVSGLVTYKVVVWVEDSE